MTTHSKTGFRTLDLTYTALFSVLIAVGAWLSVTLFSSVPFTLQTFGVFMALLTLGGRRGTYAVLVYLLMGAVGLPVFAGFKGSLGVLLGMTGGYILGFVATALIYWVLTTLLGTSRVVKIIACILGLALCYAFGTAWFVAVYTSTKGSISVGSALGMCVFPYLIPDGLKLALAVVISERVQKYLK